MCRHKEKSIGVRSGKRGGNSTTPVGQSIFWSNGMPWHRDGSGEVPRPVANKTAHHSQTEHEDWA
jgi:hypothetical protein